MEAPYWGSLATILAYADFEPPKPVMNWMSVRLAFLIAVRAPTADSSSWE